MPIMGFLYCQLSFGQLAQEVVDLHFVYKALARTITNPQKEDQWCCDMEFQAGLSKLSPSDMVTSLERPYMQDPNPF